MAESVWAYQVGAFRAGNGWDRVISLGIKDNLSQLVTELEQSGLQRQVERLALVAHGDNPGVVMTDPRMDQTSIFVNETVCGRISQLRDFLTPNAQVWLVACVAGRGPRGTSFLTALSTFWPGRTVIGFNTSGEYISYYFVAGDIFDTGMPVAGGCVLAGRSADELSRLRMAPDRPSAKWAREGGIVRQPTNGDL